MVTPSLLTATTTYAHRVARMTLRGREGGTGTRRPFCDFGFITGLYKSLPSTLAFVPPHRAKRGYDSGNYLASSVS